MGMNNLKMFICLILLTKAHFTFASNTFSSEVSRSSVKRKNILYLVVDDLRPEIGAYSPGILIYFINIIFIFTLKLCFISVL